MKISHTRKPFNELTDLADVVDIVKGTYDPSVFNCTKICKLLSRKYSNLVPVEVETWLYEGGAHGGGHVVCKIVGTDLLIDPTGDYVEYDNTLKLKKSMVPWIYKQVPNTHIYVSQDHSPFTVSGENERELRDEWEVLRYTSNPFYYRFRGITLAQ